MNHVIALQFITFVLCCINFRNVKYVIIMSSSIEAIVSTYLFLFQLYKPTMGYTSLIGIFSKYDLGILSDSLSVSVIWCISIVSALVTYFSMGYFVKRLQLFLGVSHLLSFFMMVFICANNMLQLYIVMELITVCIYFSIRFNLKPSALKKSVSFLHPNRFANLLVLISLIAMEYFFGNLSFDKINDTLINSDLQLKRNEWITLFLTISLLIKTSQIFSSRWIKATMAAPLPVVILIHIAIAMSIFMIIRLQNLFEYNELMQNVLVVLGLITAVWCSVKAIYSKSLTGILAYSINSQIGLMLAACGFSAYSAAIILFVTHAFSKLLLYLSIGSVTYSLSGESKLENMGGLFELLPKSYISIIIATASLINVPLLSSYYAKKQLISEIIAGNSPMYYGAIFLILITSIFTCIYLFRLIYLIFHGKNHVSEIDLAYIDENNHYINLSMYISSFFAIFSGVIFYYFVLTDLVWKDVFAFTYENYTSVTLAFTSVNLAGIVGAWLVCRSIIPRSFDFSHKIKFLQPSDLSNFFNLSSRNFSSISDKFLKLQFAIDHKLCFLLFFLLLIFKIMSGV